MSSLAIVGAGGHGKVVADTAIAAGWSEISFFDDAWPLRKNLQRWPIVGTVSDLLQQLQNFDGMVIAIGNNQHRLQMAQSIWDHGASLVSILHPFSYVSQDVILGEGTVIFAGAVVNVDASLGACTIINTAASVDHDCVLGDAVHISPGAHLAGSVRVGSCSWIGIGSAIRQGIAIGQNCLVAAGAVVVANVPDEQRVAGVPARLLYAKVDK